jgi:hypothetical protein
VEVGFSVNVDVGVDETDKLASNLAFSGEFVGLDDLTASTTAGLHN